MTTKIMYKSQKFGSVLCVCWVQAKVKPGLQQCRFHHSSEVHTNAWSLLFLWNSQ